MEPRSKDAELALAQLEPWAIYGARVDAMPTSPGRVFLPIAVRMVFESGSAHGDRTALDAQGDVVERHATRDPIQQVAARFARLLRNGSMTSHARPVGGRSSIRLSHTHWDHDDEIDAVATGMMPIPAVSGDLVPHWLFLENAEVAALAELSALVEEPLNPHIGHGYQLQLRIEALSDPLTSNIGALVGTHVTPASGETSEALLPSAAALTAMLSDAKLMMTPNHRDALVEHAAGWLREEFGKEVGKRVAKGTYRTRALSYFGEVVAGRTFERIWVEATKTDPRRRKPGRI